ncbi:anti-sigma factor family protein [Chitinophaga solisilvae]|uniref:anti-sigma factor family protein n=1 Tax=Chitinophaga solisilvae TaxID=1233460 RepID=UPI00136B7013|nr:hypothetical protein [Chitinophaga solisilvae]
MAAYNNDDIIRYTEGEMLPEERSRFAAAMAADPSLAAAVEEYKLLKITLEQRLPPDAAADALRRQLTQQRAIHFKKNNRLSAVRKYLTGIAAAAVVLLAIVLTRQHRGKDLLALYGQVEMQVSAERGSNQDSLLQAAALYFNEHDYTKTLPLLHQYIAADSSNQAAWFYRGVASLRNGDAAGLPDLEKVSNGGSVFRYDAAFQIALWYAIQQQPAKAKEWLQKIPADAAIAGKASALRKELP